MENQPCEVENIDTDDSEIDHESSLERPSFNFSVYLGGKDRMLSKSFDAEPACEPILSGFDDRAYESGNDSLDLDCFTTLPIQTQGDVILNF